MDKNETYRNYYWTTVKKEKLAYVKTKKRPKPKHDIYKYDLEGNFIEKTNCHKLQDEGFTENEINQIRKACLGGQKSAKGFQWRYDFSENIENIKNIKKKSEVYIYTNIITNEKYVGQTNYDTTSRAGKSGRNYDDCPKFFEAIQKYGWENFSKEIKGNNLDQESADILEKYYINFYDTINTGYNIQGGGRQNYKRN